MPKVELVAVGTELLLGQLVDTNTAHVAAALAANGIDVFATHAVGDNRERIAGLFAAILARADGAISTGGLGPTVDDLTKEAACDALGVSAVMDEAALAELEGYFASHGRTMTENNRKQATLPQGARMLRNPYGTAPGFVASRADGKFIAALPGPPHEMRQMLANEFLPWLRARFQTHGAIYTRVLHVVGLGESQIDARIDDLFRTMENPKIGVLAHGYEVDVKIMAKADSQTQALAAIEPADREIALRLRGHVYGRDRQTLAGAVHESLQSQSLHLAVAESCTGGMLSAALTAVPGSSRSFLGGVVAYENSVKVQVLGVDEQKIASDGAVSEAVAVAMAQGARQRLGADFALATTGVAGPGGGTPEKPVGSVWLALAGPNQIVESQRLQLRGDRRTIAERATTVALTMLWKQVTQKAEALE